MQLSETEKRMVAKLQKQQRSFHRWRWAALLSATVCLGSGIYTALISQQCFKPDIGAVTVLAMVTPVEYMLLAAGTWLMTTTLINWNGKPETTLLLKLIEESSDNTCPKTGLPT